MPVRAPRILALLYLALLTVGPVPALAADRGALLRVGSEVETPRIERRYVGLFLSERGAELRRVVLRIETRQLYPKEPSYLEVTAAIAQGLPPTTIPAVLVAEEGSVVPGAVRRASIPRTVVSDDAPAAIPWGDGESFELSLGVRHMRDHDAWDLVLARGSIDQTVVQDVPGGPSWGECSYELPQLLFAGDVDRDGKLDLLVDAHPDAGTRLVLLLSSLAGPGQLVAQAGELFEGGC